MTSQRWSLSSISISETQTGKSIQSLPEPKLSSWYPSASNLILNSLILTILYLSTHIRYYIDDTLFRELGKRNFIDPIENLRQAFTGGYSPIGWKFQNSGLYQSNLLAEINPGITFQSKSGYGEEVILSDQEFSKGSHGFRLRFDEISENYRCHVLIGLYDLTKKKEEF